ncbi:UNVERIFIED_CONTAM: hypothetical protein HDU68_000308 [Siphonaria sp. JEL0065]|nr:hypothetical protein HDU68_000308 [Siphonaria sp. JEL0065]
MIENCIGTMGLPVGLALNFVINGQQTVIPMVVEEPSVVAAVSGAAKTLAASSNGNGFTATTSERNIVFAQVVLQDVKNVAQAAELIRARSREVIDIANGFVPNMLARGGGVVDVTVRTPARKAASKRNRRESEVVLVGKDEESTAENWLVVHLHLDVCDAMGANAASTVAEGVASFLASWSTFRLPLKKLAYKSYTGRQVATRMIEAIEWAQDDPFRAATHNKGIMNDWRAIEASAHAWAAGCAQSPEDDVTSVGYKPLTHYWVESDPDVVVTEDSEDGLYFCGEMEVPISVGTKGGVLKTNPVYGYTLGMMGNPDSKQLAMAMVSVGLAQNFAAMRALSTEGIQRGHMSLHAKNIAIAAGAPAHAINECVAYMVDSGRVSETLSNPEHPPRAPSTFYLETTLPEAPASEPLTLNIAFETLGDKPVHLLMSATTPSTDLCKKLFNARFDYSWVTSTLSILDKVELSTIPQFPARSNRMLVKKLKLLSVLMNILLRSMMAQWPNETTRLVDKIVRLAVSSGRIDPSFGGGAKKRAMSLANTSRPATATGDVNVELQVGRPLLLALWQVFELRVLQWVGHEPLAHLLLETQLEVLKSLTDANSNNQTIGASPLHQVSTTPEDTSSDDEPLMFKGEGKKPQLSVTASANETMRALHTVIEKQSKRFQTSQFLLCDASSHDPNLLTVPRLRLLKAIGDLMAWEQMTAHDVCKSRLARDLVAVLFVGEVVGSDVELEHVTKDGNGFVFWLQRTLGNEGIRALIADAVAEKGGDFAVVEWIRGVVASEDGTATPSKKAIQEAVSSIDLHVVLKSQIIEFVQVSSKEEELVKLIQEEEGLKIYNKETLLGISWLYRQYYGVETFFVKA